MLVFDLESDGLLDTITQVWCIGIFDTKTEQYVAYYGASLAAGIERLRTAPIICGHNVIDYDIPAIGKLYPGWKPEGKVVDTVILSRLLWPDITGGHSLSAWGDRLKFPKGDHSDWTQLSDEMLEYMQQDVMVTAKLYRACIKRSKGNDWTFSSRIEHDFQSFLSEQRDNGWYFLRDAGERLLDTMTSRIDEIDASLNSSIPDLWVSDDPKLTVPIKKDGTPAARAINWIYKDCDVLPNNHDIGGDFTKLVRRWNYGSRQQMQTLLLRYGWKPTEYTEKGSPKLDEDSLKSVTDPIGGLLADRFVLVTRTAQLRNWLDAVRPDSRIESKAIGQGTPTGRCRHQVIVNVPTGRAPWGEEIRKLFACEQGTRLVGIDAAGLELRMLSHYMKDRQYQDILLNDDIHTYNQKLAGLPTRDDAKTFIYALLYGAGDAKIGQIINGGPQDGARLRAKFMRGLPKYAQLVDWVKAEAAKGWVPGIDGRRVPVRSEHSALNSLLQSAGSITVKLWTLRTHQLVHHNNLPVKFVGHFHDEINAEVSESSVKRYIAIATKSMKFAEQRLNITCPLDVTAKVGDNWYDVH